MRFTTTMLSALAFSVLAACASDAKEGDRGVTLDSPAEDPNEGAAELARPAYEITLPSGSALRFYLWPDGSAGVLEVGQPGAPSVLGLGDLEDASPAELFWAASVGREVPADLVRHHEAVAARGDRRGWAEVTGARAAGWATREIEQLARSGAQAALVDCVNVTFAARHCLPDPAYTGDLCFFDRSSNVGVVSPLSRRYKAGVCVDAGNIHDRLSFRLADCDSAQASVDIWNLNIGVGGYLTFTWLAGAVQPSRRWTHVATLVGAGDLFDHGQKWRRVECILPP